MRQRGRPASRGFPYMQGGSMPGFVIEWDTTDHLYFVCDRCEIDVDVAEIHSIDCMGGKRQLAISLCCPRCSQRGQYKVTFSEAAPTTGLPKRLQQSRMRWG